MRKTIGIKFHSTGPFQKIHGKKIEVTGIGCFLIGPQRCRIT